mgnify:CR=1 FL=1
MKNTVVMVLFALMSATLVLSGCKKASEKLTDKLIEKSLKSSGAGDAKVDVANGKVSIKTDKGQMEMSTGESVALPADFPKDIYVIKGAKIQTAMKTPEGHMLQLSVERAKEKIAESYVSEMKAQGWTSDASMDMGETSTRLFKKDNRQVAVMISQKDSGAELVITSTTEK